MAFRSTTGAGRSPWRAWRQIWGRSTWAMGARVLPFCKEAAQDAWLRLRLESGVRGDRPGKQATEQVFVRQRGKEGIGFALRRLQGA